MGKPRQVVPSAVFLDEPLESSPSGLVAALLKVEIGQQHAPFEASGEQGTHLQIAPDFRQAVKAKIQVGLEKVQIFLRAELEDGLQDRCFGRFELGYAAGERSTMKQ